MPCGRWSTATWRNGVANLGKRPTFGKLQENFEVHLFDFAGDLYGQVLRVALVDFIRPEMKFAGPRRAQGPDRGGRRGGAADTCRSALSQPWGDGRCANSSAPVSASSDLNAGDVGPPISHSA